MIIRYLMPKNMYLGKKEVIFSLPGLHFWLIWINLDLYPCKNNYPTPKKVSPMKTELHIEATPVVSRTIVKLALLGGLTLGLVYGVLMVFVNAVKIFE